MAKPKNKSKATVVNKAQSMAKVTRGDNKTPRSANNFMDNQSIAMPTANMTIANDGAQVTPAIMTNGTPVSTVYSDPGTIGGINGGAYPTPVNTDPTRITDTSGGVVTPIDSDGGTTATPPFVETISGVAQGEANKSTGKLFLWILIIAAVAATGYYLYKNKKLQ